MASWCWSIAALRRASSSEDHRLVASAADGDGVAAVEGWRGVVVVVVVERLRVYIISAAAKAM